MVPVLCCSLMVEESGGEFSVSMFVPVAVDGCEVLTDDCEDVESCLVRDIAPSAALAADSSS